MSISRESEIAAIKDIGKYLIDHADELHPIAWSDMKGNDIQIHIKRREVADVNCS